VPGLIRVVPEALHASAEKVTVQADELHLRHAAANGRIEAAQVGVPAGSASALSAAVAKWHADSAVLFGRLVEHGEGLRGAAAGYASTESANTADVEAVGDQAGTVDPRL
jgi:hypothetical protein